MLKHPDNPPDITKFPVRQLARRKLEERVLDLENNRLKLRIPVVADQFDTSKGHHFHLYPELFIQVSGTSLMHFPREIIRLTPGVVVIVPRGMPHSETTRNHPGPFMNLVFAYGQRSVHFHNSAARSDNTPQVQNISEFVAPEAEDLYRHLDEAVSLFHRGRDLRATAVRGLLMAHFACLLHGLAMPESGSSRESFRVARCRQLVRQHLATPELNVQWLARQLSCAADYLSNCFHAETGITLTRHINTQRVQQAQALLEDSAMNVSEIAHACGYNDPGYFTRVFRITAGMTPKSYRCRHAQSPE